MKKFIAVIMLVFVAFISQAQTLTASVELGNTTYANVLTNYTLTNTTAQYFEFHAAKEKPTTQDYFVSLSKVSGTPTRVAVALWVKKFVDSPYVAIGSYVPWTLTQTDTTLVISNATVSRYSYFKVVFTPAGTGVSKINLQRFKIYLE